MTDDQLAPAPTVPPATVLPRSTPTAEGVDARAIEKFVTALETTPGVEPHGLMILRHGRVLAEGWWAPYSPDRVHLLYSLSKSFTSTAVGFAVAEGLMGLDDTVISHFPELEPEITDERSRRIRVRHLLAMASGHREETVQRAYAIDPVDLVRGFLLIPPDEEPGTLFCYNQPCTFTLGAIVQRLTGGSLTDYLGPRLFDKLGIDDFGWQRDPSGRQLAYSGFHAPTEAVAKLGQLYLQQGVWAGERLLSAEWVEEATRSHIDNSEREEPDWAAGYGFQFWLARHGFRGDGAYGQFCVILPEQDVVVAITGQSPDMQAVLSAAWAELLPGIGGDEASGVGGGSGPAAATAAGSPDADDALERRLAGLALEPVDDAAGEVPSGEFSAARGNDHPDLARAVLAASGDDVTLTIDDGETVEVAVGRGAWTVSEAFAASGGLVDGGYRVDLIFLETPHRLRLTFDGASATFAARWVTQPLSGGSLADLRRPRD